MVWIEISMNNVISLSFTVTTFAVVWIEIGSGAGLSLIHISEPTRPY